MSKVNVRTQKADARKRASTPAPATAAEAIARTLALAHQDGALPPPSAEALAELRKIVEHNDVAPRGARVPADAAIEVLRSHGWLGKSRVAFDAVCAKHLGRRSYGQA